MRGVDQLRTLSVRLLVDQGEGDHAHVDLGLIVPLVGIAACLCVLGVSLAVDGTLGKFVSFSLGFLGLCLLMAAAAFAPIRSMVLWGAIFLPLTGLWLVPALDAGIERIAAFVMLVVIGAVLYGSTAAVLIALWQIISLRWSLRPLLVSVGLAITLGLSVVLAEVLAAAAGFVLAPIGLLGVYGGTGCLVATLGLFAAGGVLVGLAACIVFSFAHRAALSACVFALSLLVGLISGPDRPDLPAISIAPISHDPDPKDKWTTDGSVQVYDALVDASTGLDTDLVIWPENAVTATFDLAQIADEPPLGDRAHLFGMTRYAGPDGPALVNSAVLLERGRVQVSDKVHLVPVIERSMPFFAPTDLILGTRRIFTLADDTRILPLLCYEVAFPVPDGDLDENPDIIVVLAAETGFWQRMTGAIAARHARARELETGIRVVRVSDRR